MPPPWRATLNSTTWRLTRKASSPSPSGRALARERPQGPAFGVVNPGSLLASKMVKEGWGVAVNDLSMGVEILRRAALSDEFAAASGAYFDNDAGRFSDPHPGAMNAEKERSVMRAMKAAVGGIVERSSLLRRTPVEVPDGRPAAILSKSRG